MGLIIDTHVEKYGDEGDADPGDYDYEWSSGHTPCGDDDNC